MLYRVPAANKMFVLGSPTEVSIAGVLSWSDSAGFEPSTLFPQNLPYEGPVSSKPEKTSMKS